ncbi:MAG: fumarylacetoacetate hydrolase family protein [Actinomycetota bacterium]|nr:fumarylacetoacetate hydrolase family protein [Actinomycetota bacterium]
MRLATFTTPVGQQHVGALLSGGRLLDLTAAGDGAAEFYSMLALIDAGPPALATARNLVGQAEQGELDHHTCRIEDIQLLAPIPRPRKNVYCVGLNFRSHVAQNAEALGQPFEIPDVPLFFSKPVTAVVGPGATINCDRRLTHQLDYEVELAAVIGRGGTWIAAEEAAAHIFGYTLVNDISARDLQWRTSQFLYGKGLDTYCPMGPIVVTRDELPEVDDVILELYVNGEQRQSERAGNMLFPPEAAIAELSRGLTLEPGDVISLGTPGGCGYQLTPPDFLKDGDLVECRATAIGALINQVTEVQVALAAHA